MPATFPNWLIADAATHEMDAATFLHVYIEDACQMCPADYQQEQIALYRRAAMPRPSLALFADPTSPAQARRQAGIWERALRLFVEDGYIWEPRNDNLTAFYCYTPCRTRLYRADLLQDTCTCMSFQHDGDCKHRIALARLFGEHVRQYALQRLRLYTND